MAREDLHEYLVGVARGGSPAEAVTSEALLAPVGSQEVWAN